jgi:hypothetical protein
MVVLEDDLDGSKAAETLTFGLDGRAYEIDLSEQHASALRQVLARHIAAGRRVGRIPHRSPFSASPAGSGAANEAAAMRACAVDNGYEISAGSDPG